MIFRPFRPLALMLGLALATTGCEDVNIGTNPEPEAQAAVAPEVSLAFQQEAAAAASAGDTERADALQDGIRAFRFGIRPSDIEVKIKNETFSYKAIVVGRVYLNRNGERVLVRVLLAWDGNRPPAVLHVAQKTDKGLFGGTPPGNSEVGGARGRWNDRANQQVWMATAGSSDIELLTTGHACPIQPAAELALSCVVGSWDVRVNGKFELLPDLAEQVEIHTNEGSVIGVVLSPTS